MTPNEYQKLCSRTSCDQVIALDRIIIEEQASVKLMHSIIGLQGEVGELASIFLKRYYYGRQLDTEKFKTVIKDELGDILWFVCQGLTACGFTMQEVMEANIAKLKVRYPDKYTDEQSAQENRDVAAEMRALQGYNEETKTAR